MNLESTTKSKNLSKTQITINTHLTTLHPETFFLPPLNPPLPSKNSVSLSHPLSSIRLHIHPSYLLARFIYLSTRSLTLPHRELFPLPTSGSGNRRHQVDKLALPPGNRWSNTSAVSFVSLYSSAFQCPRASGRDES